MDYLDFISQHQNHPYWLEILNTSYDMLPHKFEILMSELSKNRYEIKKVVIENLDDYLSSKETALKMLLEIEKHKSYTKTASEIFNQEKIEISKCNVNFFDESHSFLTQNSLIFEMDNFMKIVKKQGNEENLGKLMTFLTEAIKTLNLTPDDKNKLWAYFEKMTEKTQSILFNHILTQVKKNAPNDNNNELISISSYSSKLKPEELVQELFKIDYKKVLLEKLEKYRPLRGSNDYLLKIFGVYSKSLEKSLDKISSLYSRLKNGDSLNLNVGKIKSFQRYFKNFEENFRDLVKQSAQDESFMRLLQCVKMNETSKNLVLMLLESIIEEHFQKILNKFTEKLNLLNRYAYLNNLFFYLLKKVDNNYFEDLGNVANDGKMQKTEKIQKLLIFARKNEIFSLIINNVIGIYQFALLYLKDKMKFERLNHFLVDSLKEYLLETQRFLERKKSFTEDERGKIMKKMEKFLQIVYFMIDNNFLNTNS